MGTGGTIQAGLDSLKIVGETGIAAIPGITAAGVQGSPISHCDGMKYRFAVADPEPGADTGAVLAHRKRFNAKNAALWHPLLQVYDPLTKRPSSDLENFV